MMTTTTLALASLLLGANAHMFISSPVPIPGTAPKDPLDPSGSNFPCHGVTLPSAGGQIMAAGSQQKLSFELGGGANTATHGGGSCQLSITYETDAAKQKDPSIWKVIYSIEGGCPTDASGNLERAVACASAGDTNCVNSFPFTIPKGVKNGHAIMAWTWQNAVGNREFYMNCASAQFTGGDGSEMDSFPSMFVANLASVNSCPTTEDTNVKYPNPGKYVTTMTKGNPYPLALPTGTGCAQDGGSAPDGGSSSISSSTASSNMPVAAPPSTSTMAPSAVSTAAPTPSFTTSEAPIPSSTAGSTPTSCASSEVSCATPGALVCIDPTHFGICDVDHCAVPQAVAPGTTCQNEAIVKRRRRSGRVERAL